MRTLMVLSLAGALAACSGTTHVSPYPPNPNGDGGHDSLQAHQPHSYYQFAPPADTGDGGHDAINQ